MDAETRTEPLPSAVSTRHSDRAESQTVLRACEVLRAFQGDADELSSSEIIRHTRLPKTTVLRLLRTLVHGMMLERTKAGIYRRFTRPVDQKRYRIGFASQGDSEFASTVLRNLELASVREHMQLITVNNRYSAREALRNADYLIKQEVDLVLEFQTFDRIAPAIASKFQETKTPVIAIDIPHPGATYFGANNFKAGRIAGKALGRWAQEHWQGKVDQILLLELPIAGPLVELRVRGLTTGLQAECPSLGEVPVVRLNARGDLEEVYGVVRQFLRRNRAGRTLIGAVNDIGALAAVHAFEDGGLAETCAVVGQNAILGARNELRRPKSRLIGSVAYYPERYGMEVLAIARMLLEQKPVPNEIFTEHQLITPRNVDLLYPLDRKTTELPKAVDTLLSPRYASTSQQRTYAIPGM